jgi:hypothetical protein
MPLILAIEPDRRQAAQLQAVVKRRLDAELILVETTERALDAIGNRMPDLVLVPALLSPQDDAALAAALRVIAAAAHVQMLTIPVLGSAKPERKVGGVLSALRRGKPKAAETDGCDPGMFAEQIASYLERAEVERPRSATAVVSSEASRDGEPEVRAALEGPHGETDPAWRVDSIAAFEEFVDEPLPSPPLLVAETGPATTAPVEIESTEPEPEPEPVPLASLEPLAAPVADESVSLALEEAVRALFSGPAEDPPAELPSEALAQSAIDSIDVRRAVPMDVESDQIEAESAIEDRTMPEVDVAEDQVAWAPYDEAEPPPHVAVEPTDHHVVSPRAAAAERDEWEALEELIGALDAMPLAAIEATAVDEWIAPVQEEPERPLEPAEAAPMEAEFASVVAEPEVQPATAPARSEREWVALIESLRHDVERLRNERAEKPVKKNGAPKAGRSEAPRADSPRPAEAARPQVARPGAPPAERKAKPIQDEWGFFDPEQCGFAALLAKLDEVTDSEENRELADQPRRSQ